ncbi:MAG: adenosylhomocysteinase [Acidimicrobiia bacterium]|nr:adenosylhomocysteinase [Acidimicrobiia bacterium]
MTWSDGRIEWTQSRMPLLAEVATEFVGTKPFDGLTIGVSLHLEPKTAVLLDVLLKGGARIVATGNLGTTQSATVAALNEQGIEAIGSSDDDLETHLGHVATIVAKKPDLLLDNGADLVAASLGLGHTPRGGTEETTSGAFRLRDEFVDRVSFPVIVINDSPLKAIVENKHGVGQSILESFVRITNLMIQGKRIVVAGYGWCGRGIAHYARALGGEVMVVEIDEIKALEAAVDGFRVAPLDQAAPWGTVFITATGAEGVVDAQLAMAMPDGAVLANAGHFDTEIDVPALRKMSVAVDEPTEGIERLTMSSGSTLTLLTGGRMFNLGGPSPKGNSIEAMDLGFTLQALSLERLVVDPGSLQAGAQPVPDDINRRAAGAMVRTMMGS